MVFFCQTSAKYLSRKPQSETKDRAGYEICPAVEAITNSGGCTPNVFNLVISAVIEFIVLTFVISTHARTHTPAKNVSTYSHRCSSVFPALSSFSLFKYVQLDTQTK